MKIVYFLEGTFNSAGIERIITGKANWLVSKGYDVTIVTTDQKGRPDFFPLKGVKRIDFDLNYRDHDKNIIKDYFRRRSLIRKETELIKALVNELKPDILVSTFRYENNILPKLKDDSRKIAEIHFSRFYRLNRRRKGIHRLIDLVLTWKDKRQAKKFDSFVCLTEEDKENWNGVKKIKVINNFIEETSGFSSSLENKSVIAVGRLSREKGFSRLIEAWRIVNKRFPDWVLDIYGDGELKNDLEKQIKRNGLNNVKLHPPTKDIDQKYRESSIFIMSSYYEGMPVVMLEAMGAGLPVVTYNFQCGPKDIVKNGENGIIVKNGDIEGMANALCQVIESPRLRKEMGKKSLEMAKKYEKEKIMSLWEELFGSL